MSWREAGAVLGSTAVRKLETAATEAVVTIGSDQLTRGQLAAVGCYNFSAARNLSALLEVLHVDSLRDVYENIRPVELALPHLGVISLAVLGAAFEVKGIGGQDPLGNYLRKHTKRVTTFDTIKHQVETERQRARRERRRSRRQERAVAADTTTT